MMRGAGESGGFSRSRGGRNLHEIEEHQPCMQLPGSRDMAIQFFLFLCAEHEIKAVVLVVSDRDVFVVGIHDEIAASGLVVLVDEPALDAVHQFGSDMPVQELAVDAEPPDQHRRIDHVALLLRHVLSDAFPSCVRKMVGEYACVGDRKGANDFTRIVDFKKGVCLSHQLPCVVEIVRGEEFVKVFVSAAERGAGGDDLRGKRNAGAPVVQKGHLPDSLSSLTRRAFADSKSCHTLRSAEKSMRPRRRAFLSAVRTKRTAASPDRTGMLLIARAISDLPFAAYYTKNGGGRVIQIENGQKGQKT